MKKAIVKSFMLGICAALSLTVTVPVLAGSVDAEGFNTFRLKDGDGTVFDWGENLTLEDGKSVPSSITYDGEEYVSMSRLKEMLGDNLLMNGDSATYTFLDAGMQIEYEVVEEVTKPDAMGTIWTYQVRKYDGKPNHVGFHHIETNQYYLVIFDEEHKNSRAYELLGPSAWEFTEDCVYFAKYSESFWEPERDDDNGVPVLASMLTLTKLLFANTADTQDGEIIFDFNGTLITEGGSIRPGHPYISDGTMYWFFSAYGGNGISGVTWRGHLAILRYENQDNPSNTNILEAGTNPTKIDLVKNGYIMYRTYASKKGVGMAYSYYKDMLEEDGEAVSLSEDEYFEIIGLKKIED